MKTLLTALITIAPVLASADILKCTFTEPFVNTEYSMVQQSLTYTTFAGVDGKMKVTKIKNVSFQIKAAGEFELVSKNGTVLQKLSLNKQGSDGMSDRAYPYAVKDSHPMMTANNGSGGCSSNYLH